MNTKDYLRILVEDIHHTVVATNDQNGHPVARVIDMMLYDEEGLYFLTAKGKDFYSQLQDQGYMALSGMTGGEGTMNKKSVSLHGKVRNIGVRYLDKIFEKNPYMAEIYPEPETRETLEVFQLYEADGEYFDLSTKPITRVCFLLGQAKKDEQEYFITEKCQGCGTCYDKCPQKCIDRSYTPFTIRQENCILCGNCLTRCPVGAIVRK